MCVITDSTYDEVFSPDAPPYPPLAPVKGRATPYTETPQVCTINYRTGTIRCVDNESHGGLYPPVYARQALYPSPNNFNYVTGNMVVAEPPDSPLNRILSRPPTGPWQLVGAAVSHNKHEPPREKTMLVYAQVVDSARDRYNYRVVDNNQVPLDVGYKVRWKNDGEPLHIPGYGKDYTLMLYNTYR